MINEAAQRAVITIDEARILTSGEAVDRLEHLLNLELPFEYFAAKRVSPRSALFAAPDPEV